MLSLLARFIFLMAIYLLAARVIRAMFGRGRRRTMGAPGARREKSSNAMVRDPVCGMYLDPSLAFRCDRRQQQELYFCSDECRKKFLAAPSA